MTSIVHFFVKQSQNVNDFQPSGFQRANKMIKLEGSSVGQAYPQIICNENINTMSASVPTVSNLNSCEFDKAGGE